MKQGALTCCDHRKVEQRVSGQQREQVDGLTIWPLAEQPCVELADVCGTATGWQYTCNQPHLIAAGSCLPCKINVQSAPRHSLRQRLGSKHAGSIMRLSAWQPFKPTSQPTSSRRKSLTRLERDAAQPAVEAHGESAHLWREVAQHEKHCKWWEGWTGKRLDDTIFSPALSLQQASRCHTFAVMYLCMPFPAAAATSPVMGIHEV